ncbi:MAG: hypothetical protein ACI81V_000355 [Lentimonas sp.]|jgi:hypothetical protein
MLKTIITHPGGAHKDDFLACALLLTQSPVVIERREPTESELTDPSIAVLDIGHAHNPELNNFDHHQFPRDHVPICALSLVLQHLGLYQDAREFCDWLEVAEWFDCRGPVDTAAWLGVDRETLGKLNSPIDITLLKCFAAQSVHTPGEPVWELMRQVGQDLVDYVTGLRARLDFVAQHAQVWQLQSGDNTFKALYMPRTDPMPDEASAGLARHVQQLGLKNEILALIYPDSRGAGYGMRRFNDDPRLDFSQLQSEADVHFTHARGFIAKTSANETARLKEMLKLAYIG